jgi:tetratricopeptide (TPR) repeat protein
MGFLGFTTYQRNKVWMSEINLWSDVCKKSWNKARPFDALGNAYEDNKMYDKAIEAYREAIKRDSAYVKAYNNMGYLYFSVGMDDKAKNLLFKSAAFSPQLFSGSQQFGQCLFKKRERVLCAGNQALQNGY